MKKKIAIIGLGNIGMMYDYHKTSPFTLTYASALKKSKKIGFYRSGRFIKKKKKFIRKKI